MTVRDLMEMVCDHCFGDLKWCCSRKRCADEAVVEVRLCALIGANGLALI